MARTFFPDFRNPQEKMNHIFLYGFPKLISGTCRGQKQKRPPPFGSDLDWKEILLLEIFGDDVWNQCQINLVVSTAKQMKHGIAQKQPKDHTPNKCKKYRNVFDDVSHTAIF